MALLDNLEITPEDYGKPFDVVLGGRAYQMEIDLNKFANFLTVRLWDADGNALVNGEKLVINQRLFASLNSNDYPTEDLVPMDESGQEIECNGDNFGDTVKLTFDDRPADGSGFETPEADTNESSGADTDDDTDIDLEGDTNE
ncbi:MAG: phage baseplate plug family protein [Lactiplantibacillus plantarum]